MSNFIFESGTSSLASSSDAFGLVLCIGRAEALSSETTLNALKMCFKNGDGTLETSFKPYVKSLIGKRRHASGTSFPLLLPGQTEEMSFSKLVVHAVAESSSRHNASLRVDDIAKCVEASATKSDSVEGGFRVIMLVNDVEEAFASGCALARSLPLFSTKSSFSSWADRRVVVHFLFNDSCTSISNEKLLVLKHSAIAIQRTAALVDMPTAVLHTTEFVRKAKRAQERLVISRRRRRWSIDKDGDGDGL